MTRCQMCKLQDICKYNVDIEQLKCHLINNLNFIVEDICREEILQLNKLIEKKLEYCRHYAWQD